ncbi:oligo-1,6-glucosidase [Microlunatus phosphovorus NM-1]|uniref:Oligo-1,6-glucosidase n=1 Tax=Microlunatus phosphovorus (strain ATCC 700054 / DSM 10555 / JCM 9379 / NBRC 101784 / NCIMB 13414 / VKM Ac-1990 / NM-1) TaxID=1032480 RepID=F5XT81_MICPN|nr:alpha-glucosidase [Microlunatus phosphovorus]BAK34953.1 oligo-1,6-glucosidase [Microlunatus phosphovorus NM-1]
MTDHLLGEEARVLRPDGWWRSAVVYQIYPRSFQDSDGDGIGDIPGITSRLDYLAELGVDVIWLSPVYRSPQCDNGYDISDYRDVDPLFGTLADLETLIAAAHERGIRLVMDLVVNHTSDEHPWFIESRDPASPKRDWYFWRPARPGAEPGAAGSEPNDRPAAFAPSAWTYDPVSGEYYLGIFSPGQPDLNWENPEVRQAVYAMMRWWVDRGVDGFRMDVINLISKPIGFTTDALDPSGVEPTYEGGSGPRLDEFLAEMNREVRLDDLNLLTVGEMPGSTVETAIRATDPGRHELNMVFTFEHVMLDRVPGGQRWDLVDLPLPVLKNNLAHWQLGLADVGWNSLYFDNHDQARAVSRFGDDSPEHRVASAKTLATVLHLHKGTPYVYQGEELGMTNAPFTTIEQYRDISALNVYAAATAGGVPTERVMHFLETRSRDHARTPMQWDATDAAGFTTATPWIEVNPNYPTINAAAASEDADSVFAHFQKLIALRHDNAVVREGRFELLLPEHDRLWAFTRTLDDERLLVLANCSSRPADLPLEDLPDHVDAELLLGTHLNGRPDSLAPWESRILRLDQS